LKVLQTGAGFLFVSPSETHAASYPMDTGGPFPGGKAISEWSWPLISI